MAQLRERQNLADKRELKRRRLAVLERQQAQHGIDTTPAVVTEIEDLRKEIGEIDAVLNPPLGVPRHVWDSLDAEQQRTYLTALVMQLQADFTDCQVLMFKRLRWWMIGLVASNMLVVAVSLALRVL